MAQHDEIIPDEWIIHNEKRSSLYLYMDKLSFQPILGIIFE